MASRPKFERLSRQSDPKFQELVTRASDVNTLAVVEMAVPFLMLLANLAVEPASAQIPARLGQALATSLVGASTMLLSPLPWSRQHSRLLSGISAWAVCTLFLWTTGRGGASFPATEPYIFAGTALVLITAAAIVRFHPLEMLAAGASIEATYLISGWLAGLPGISKQAVFLTVLVLLATGISKSRYEHLRTEFEAQQKALRVAEALAGAQLRAQLAESAVAIGKLAGALTHEINTPLGAMRSSIETLLTLTDRQVDAPPVRREILAKMRAELCHSIAESAARIEDVMGRLRRFISLDDAELRSADINELLSEVTLLFQEQVESGHIRMQLDLERPLPRFTCRPQLLSEVFSSLLSNAINAVNGDGAIGISTRRNDSVLEVTVRDNGRGMNPEEADSIFDPTFKISEGRVASGNWSLFNARQIVYEHGGNIRVHTAPGQGTAVHVSLPLGR